MMCPVCKRDLAPTLSICLTCGAMIHDTVREELETKISKTANLKLSNSGRLSASPVVPNIDIDIDVDEPAAKVAAPTRRVEQPPQPPLNETPPAQIKLKTPPSPIAKPVAARFDTSDLGSKKTSKTLVEFQTKKATVPEWRLQLQNSVRQKVGPNRRIDQNVEQPQMNSRTTNGANALKVEFVEDEQPRHQNPRVASALKRIEESRSKFSNQRVPEQRVNIGKSSTPANRSYPFNVVARSKNQPSRPAGQKAAVNPSPKPMLVSPLKIEKRGFDTNKLPPLEKAEPKPGKISIDIEIDAPTSEQVAETTRDRWTHLAVEEETHIENESSDLELPETDEIEDLAPLAMRFNAGLFDFIIGVFASLILLSPFILSGGSWMSLAGFFAISAVVAIVMFLYLTISLAFVGRTFGMRLFSLELVDVEENAYPTLHQAAVSSAVFLFSLALAGIGFLPIFFNEERRAAHDILSGTILIREI
jgi:uncharacterized RDD family membrane protein YckC